jgi:hypothetical protein
MARSLLGATVEWNNPIPLLFQRCNILFSFESRRISACQSLATSTSAFITANRTSSTTVAESNGWGISGLLIVFIAILLATHVVACYGFPELAPSETIESYVEGRCVECDNVIRNEYTGEYNILMHQLFHQRCVSRYLFPDAHTPPMFKEPEVNENFLEILLPQSIVA